MFKDRTQAGKLLAGAVKFLKGKDVIVLGIPRGGLPVAKEVADELEAPLDMIITRKIGAPGNPEFAVGAVTQYGEAIIDRRVVRELNISEEYLKEETAHQVEEIKARLRKYRGDVPFPALDGKTVVIVDDGIATGYTIRAAIKSVRRMNPASVILAVPVGPQETISALSSEADRVVCILTPEFFYAIGEFYENFEQVQDEEVRAIMSESQRKKLVHS